MFTVKNSLNGEIFTAPANEIIAQILEAEMGSHYHIEALKAQAVAAYSWLLCSGAATGATPSAPLKVAKANAINAANAVAGKVVLYDGKVAQTAYHGSSAGHTANSEDIWSSRIPYLVSVDSSVDKNAPKYQTIITYSSVDLAAKVREATGIDLNKISDKNQWFKCTYDENGVYVKTINIGGTVKKGTYFRTDILKYSIRSSAYTISYNSLDDKFTIVVKGNGHGVGMSQTGANAYANSGWTYEQILKHYYKGTTLGTYF
jgi:stage II sporulation protein D